MLLHNVYCLFSHIGGKLGKWWFFYFLRALTLTYNEAWKFATSTSNLFTIFDVENIPEEIQMDPNISWWSC